MPWTELHRLAKENAIDQHNIKLYSKYLNTEDLINFHLHTTNYNDYRKLTPLHVALIQKNRRSILFLVAFGADIYTRLTIIESDALARNRVEYSALSLSNTFREEFSSIISGGSENAMDILISEGLVDNTDQQDNEQEN